MEQSCATTDTFQLIEESELVPESLSTTSASNEEYISFKDAMNQIFHEFPSLQDMMAARNRAAAQDAVESITLIDCAFITQLWLQMKANEKVHMIKAPLEAFHQVHSGATKRCISQLTHYGFL